MALIGGESSGGSQNSAFSNSNAESFSHTYGAEATMSSAEAARIAFERQKELLEMTQKFNAEEAQKQRDWQELMSNTIYTRSVENMKQAGINPILASGMGLSGASVGSGATASVGVPSAQMAQTIADQNSAYTSSGHSESQGSSWQNSESGLATAIKQLGGLFAGVLNALGSAHTLEVNLNGLEKFLDTGDQNGNGEVLDDSIKGLSDVVHGTKSLGSWLKNEFNPFNSPFFAETRRVKKAAKDSEYTIKHGINVFEQ